MVGIGRVEVDENDQPETVELYIETGAVGTPRDGSVKQWKGTSQGTVFVPLVGQLDNSLLSPFLFFPALNTVLEESEKKGTREKYFRKEWKGTKTNRLIQFLTSKFISWTKLTLVNI